MSELINGTYKIKKTSLRVGKYPPKKSTRYISAMGTQPTRAKPQVIFLLLSGAAASGAKDAAFLRPTKKELFRLVNTQPILPGGLQ
jgi:hypothetical protein